MAETLWDSIKKYAKLIDDIVVDFLTDVKSVRYQLIFWAFVLNFYVLDLVKQGKADYKLAAVTVGLLTIVYTLYFASKHNQAVMENNNKQDAADDDDAPEEPKDSVTKAEDIN